MKPGLLQVCLRARVHGTYRNNLLQPFVEADIDADRLKVAARVRNRQVDGIILRTLLQGDQYIVHAHGFVLYARRDLALLLKRGEQDISRHRLKKIRNEQVFLPLYAHMFSSFGLVFRAQSG